MLRSQTFSICLLQEQENRDEVTVMEVNQDQMVNEGRMIDGDVEEVVS